MARFFDDYTGRLDGRAWINSKQIERRTSNVQHRTSNIDGATLYLILKQANRSLQRAFRQAQGLSTSKAAESNFEG